MATGVNIDTNGVEENIAATIADIKDGARLDEAFKGLLERDVAAMMDGGVNQGKHFIRAGLAWTGEVEPSVWQTYTDIGMTYYYGWEDIADAASRAFKSEDARSGLTRLQTRIAEGTALYCKNLDLGVDNDNPEVTAGFLDEDLRSGARALWLFFMDATTEATTG